MDFIRKYDIELEKEHYYAGETLRGRVVIENIENLRVTGVQLFLRGKAHVEWRITRGGERRTVKEDQYFIDEKLIVWGSDSVDDGSISILPRGDHRFPFDFHLPVTCLPCSFESRIGTVRYYLRVIIDIPYASPPQGLKYFTVIGPYIDCMDNRYTTPVSAMKQTTNKCLLCCCCCVSGPIRIDASLEQTAYCCGENIRIKCDVQNGSDQDVTLFCRLIQLVEFRINKGAFGLTKDLSHHVLELHCPPVVAAHSTRSFHDLSADLEVPVMPPTMVEVCKVIEINYVLRIGLHLEKSGDDLQMDFPLVVATVPQPFHVTGQSPPELSYEPADEHVEGGIYVSPEFQLGQVYDGAADHVEEVILYRPVYICVVRRNAVSSSVGQLSNGHSPSSQVAAASASASASTAATATVDCQTADADTGYFPAAAAAASTDRPKATCSSNNKQQQLSSASPAAAAALTSSSHLAAEDASRDGAEAEEKKEEEKRRRSRRQRTTGAGDGSPKDIAMMEEEEEEERSMRRRKEMTAAAAAAAAEVRRMQERNSNDDLPLQPRTSKERHSKQTGQRRSTEAERRIREIRDSEQMTTTTTTTMQKMNDDSTHPNPVQHQQQQQQQQQQRQRSTTDTNHSVTLGLQSSPETRRSQSTQGGGGGGEGGGGREEGRRKGGGKEGVMEGGEREGGGREGGGGGGGNEVSTEEIHHRNEIPSSSSSSSTFSTSVLASKASLSDKQHEQQKQQQQHLVGATAPVSHVDSESRMMRRETTNAMKKRGKKEEEEEEEEGKEEDSWRMASVEAEVLKTPEAEKVAALTTSVKKDVKVLRGEKEKRIDGEVESYQNNSDKDRRTSSADRRTRRDVVQSVSGGIAIPVGTVSSSPSTTASASSSVKPSAVTTSSSSSSSSLSASATITPS